VFNYYLLDPLRSLINQWPVKLSVAVMTSGLASLARHLLEQYSVLLQVNNYLLFLALTMFVLDLASGLYQTARYEDETFSPLKLKRSGFKFGEWAFVIYGSIVLGNAAAKAGIVVLDQVHVGAIFWLSVTDFFSMLSNLKNSEADARRWVKNVNALATGDFPIDDVTNESAQSESAQPDDES
jgi:hypothetical protein